MCRRHNFFALPLCASKHTYLNRTAGYDRNNLACMFHMVLSPGSDSTFHPQTQRRNSTKKCFFLNISLHLSSQSLTPSEIQQCSDYAKHLLQIHFLLFSSWWNKATLSVLQRKRSTFDQYLLHKQPLCLQKRKKKNQNRLNGILLCTRLSLILNEIFSFKNEF